MIIDFLRRVFALIKKEFITIWKDPKSRNIIIAMPIMPVSYTHLTLLTTSRV